MRLTPVATNSSPSGKSRPLPPAMTSSRTMIQLAHNQPTERVCQPAGLTYTAK